MEVFYINLDHNRFIVRDRQEVKPRKVESQKRVVVRYSGADGDLFAHLASRLGVVQAAV